MLIGPESECNSVLLNSGEHARASTSMLDTSLRSDGLERRAIWEAGDFTSCVFFLLCDTHHLFDAKPRINPGNQNVGMQAIF